MKYVQYLVQARVIAMSYVPSAKNTADLTTKSLPFAAHDEHARRIMGQEAYTAIYLAAHDHHLRSVMSEPHIEEVPIQRLYGKRYNGDVTGDGAKGKGNDKPRVRNTKDAPKVVFASAPPRVKIFMVKKNKKLVLERRVQRRAKKMYRSIHIYKKPQLKEPWKFMKPKAVATALAFQHEAIPEKTPKNTRRNRLYGKRYNGDVTGDGAAAAAAAAAAAGAAARAAAGAASGGFLRFTFSADENQDDQVHYIPGVGPRRGRWVRRSTRKRKAIQRYDGEPQLGVYMPRFSIPDYRDDHYARVLADAEFERSAIARPYSSPPPCRRRRLFSVQRNSHQASSMSNVRVKDEMPIPPSPEMPIPPSPMMIPVKPEIKTKVKTEVKTEYQGDIKYWPSTETLISSNPTFPESSVPLTYLPMMDPLPLVRQNAVDSLPDDADDYTREMWCHEELDSPLGSLNDWQENMRNWTAIQEDFDRAATLADFDKLILKDFDKNPLKKESYGKRFNGDLEGDGPGGEERKGEASDRESKSNSRHSGSSESSEWLYGNYHDHDGNPLWRQFNRTGSRPAGWCQRREALRCNLCCIECTDTNCLVQHVKGKKHGDVLLGLRRWCSVCCKWTDRSYEDHDNSNGHQNNLANPVERPLWQRHPLIPNAYDRACRDAIDEAKSDFADSPPEYPQTPSPASTEVWGPAEPLDMPLIAPVADAFVIRERSWGPYIVLSTVLSTISICACILWKL
jgi:hypothetical protein